jgi:hypothetical protein
LSGRCIGKNHAALRLNAQSINHGCHQYDHGTPPIKLVRAPYGKKTPARSDVTHDRSLQQQNVRNITSFLGSQPFAYLKQHQNFPAADKVRFPTQERPAPGDVVGLQVRSCLQMP